MKRQILSLLIICLSFYSHTCLCQADVLSHGGVAGQYLGWNAATGIPLQIRHNGNQQINFYTNSLLRAYFNRNSAPFTSVVGNSGYGLRIVDPDIGNGHLDLFTSSNMGGNETHAKFGPNGQVSGQANRFELRSTIAEGFYFNNEQGSGMYKFCTTNILHGFVGPNLFWRIGLQPTSLSNINGARQLEVADNTVQFRLGQTNPAGANIPHWTDFPS